MAKQKRGSNLKRKEKNKSFLKKQYSLSWEYVKECRNYIYFILGFLAFSALLGAFYQPPELVELIKKFLQDLISQTDGLNWWQMIIFILNNNLQTGFFAMILGIFFSVFPVMTAFSNGYVLGFVAEKAIAVEGIVTLWRLAPHGIFEFPALILSLALGTKLGMFLTSAKEKSKGILAFVISLAVFLFLGISLFSSLSLLVSGSVSEDSMKTILINNPLLLTLSSLLIIIGLYLLSNYIGMKVLSKSDCKRVLKEFKKRTEQGLRVFFFVVIPLLIIAGIIEGILVVLLK